MCSVKLNTCLTYWNPSDWVDFLLSQRKSLGLQEPVSFRRIAMKNTDTLVHGLALSVIKDRMWHRDENFQRCISGSPFSGLGRYLNQTFNLNHHDGSDLSKHATPASAAPMQTVWNKTKKYASLGAG